MDTFQETFSFPPLVEKEEEALASKIQEDYDIALADLPPESLQKYKDPMESCSEYKKGLSEYAFWYLCNFCYNYRFLELRICMDGEVKFHFGDCFLAPDLQLKTKSSEIEKRKGIHFLTYEKRALDSYLQVDAAINIASKQILPIWREELAPFLNRYFIFTRREEAEIKEGEKIEAGRVLDCVSSLEESLNSKVKSIIKGGDGARILHIRTENFKNTLYTLGLYDSQKLFLNIYKKLCAQIGSLGSIIVFSHTSYFIVGAISEMKEERMEFYKALDDVRREYQLKFIIYEKNLYKDELDVSFLGEGLHF